MLYYVGKFLCFLIYGTFLHLRVEGRQNIPRRGGFIIASNHISYLDPPGVGVACPRRLSYMARHDLFSNHWFSWALPSIGCFPVKRGSADISALKEAIRRVNNGGGLLLFPEGARQEAHIAKEPEAGIGFLVAKLNVPVIPVYVRGTEKALSKGSKFIKPAKVSVCFGRQIQIERGKSYQEIASTVMSHIRALGLEHK
ncbi:MAG: lysophospholipid acyltransferase family protein [Candidatus Omnitrophota bacterium]